jgi:hypothetical protein
MNNKPKVEKELVGRYFNYLSAHHVGKKQGIKRETLKAIMGTELPTQKLALQEINTNPEYKGVVSTSGSIYLCTTEQEAKTAAYNEIRSGLTRLNKGKKMLKKYQDSKQFKIIETEEGFAFDTELPF